MSINNELNDAISGNFMQVQVTVRKWGGKVTDKDLGAELENNKHATAGSLRAVKDLMAGANKELKEVNSALDSIRTYTYNRTLPWASNSDGAMRGPRLLPVHDSFEFLKEYKLLTEVYEAAKRNFLTVYEQRKAQAITNLGNAAKAEDYPDASEIDKKFHVDLDIGVVPSINDFSRMPIPAKLVEFLGDRMAARQSVAIQNAMNDLYQRILEQVQRIATQLNKEAETGEARLYKTLVSNVRDLNDLLKSSNVTEDEQITELCERIDRELCQHEVEAYKANATLAKHTAESAMAIATDIENIIEWY